MRKAQKTIPTILGILVLIGGVAVGVIATRYETIFRLGAQTETTPQDVRITNFSNNTITISWITDNATTGILSWGGASSLGRSTPDSQAGKATTHSVTLTELSANTTYYFKINSAGKEYDNNGTLWRFQTTAVNSPPSNPYVISGTVLTADGQPAKGVLVYINADGISPLSTMTSESGNWVIPLGLARSSSNMANYAQINDQLLLQIFVQAGPAGVATAQIHAQAADPTPPITIGQTHDFKDRTGQDVTQLPEASIDVPEGQEDLADAFGFLTEIDSSASASPAPTAVTLESIDNGEIITTDKPEFFGEGPEGIVLTITVQSDPINAQVTVPDNGIWKWSPPTNLEPGEHTVSIRWTDANGILRTLTRSFIVSAEEGASFEASTSATPSSRPSTSPTPKSSPSPTPKASTSPSPSAIAVATATATPSPRVSIPSTESGTPVAGSLTPTLALSIMSIGLFIAAIFVSKKAI